MNFHFPNPFKRTAPHKERELIETRSENIFLRAKAEAAAILSAELTGRCMALESHLHLATRPQRERRRDAGSVVAAKAARTAAYHARFDKIDADVLAAAKSNAMRKR